MVWVGAPLLYPLWTGRELRILPVLLAVLICQAIFAAGWTTSSWSMLAANSHRRLVRWWLANATVSVLLALALVPRYRLAGAAIGSLLGDIAFGLFLFPTLVANFLSVSTGVVYRHMFLPLLAAVPIILLGLLAKALLPGWWSIGSITVLLAMLLYPTTYLALGKPNMERIFKFARPRWLQLPR